ncbi:MAG: hypothetical protein PUP92_30970 [Rhizonema sp. PD38]|nr:hypothetical protein [Rhizonema sp. PD38]
MQRKRLLNFIASGTLGAIALVGNTPQSQASNIEDPHAYAVERYYGTITGAYASSHTSVDDLYSPSTDQNPIQSINKEMWLHLSAKGTDEWVEVGGKKGFERLNWTSNSNQMANWTGFFLSFQLCDSSGKCSYHASPYTKSGGYHGNHSYEIDRDATNTTTWNVYIDDALAGQFSTIHQTGVAVDIGIENKDTTNSFVSGTWLENINVRDTNNLWTRLTSMQNIDTNTVNEIYSTFTYDYLHNNNYVSLYHP